MHTKKKKNFSKEKTSEIHSLVVYLTELEKQEQTKPKTGRRKEII